MSSHFDLRAVATCLLHGALKIAPPEAAEWGHAMLGELHQVEGDWAALAWALGSASVLAKHALLSLLIPAPSNQIVSEGRFFDRENPMKKSTLIVAAACTVVSLLFLLAPTFREGLSLVGYGLRADRDPQTARWQKLGREAQSRGDAASMVYAAMRLPMDEGTPLAQRAVAKDPSLTWVYCFIHANVFPAPAESRARFLELLSAVSKWDPDNAVPYLAIAANASYQPDAYKDPQWLDAMQHAMAAKSYDSYLSRRVELERRVGATPSAGDSFENLIGYWLQLPSVGTLNGYAASIERQGEEAASKDAQQQAARQLWSLVNLGAMMRLRGESGQQEFFSSQLQEIAFSRLQLLLSRLGEAQEAQAAGNAGRLVEKQAATSVRRLWLDAPFLENAALAVHLLAILMMMSFVVLAAAGIIYAMGKRTSRFVRHVFTYLPGALLVSCGAFLFASYPFAQAAQALRNNPLDFDAIVRVSNLWLGPALATQWYLLPVALYLCWTVIAVGSAACVWLSFKAFHHRTA